MQFELERRILIQDLPLELLERGSRLDAELLDERRPSAPEHVKGLGLPPAAIEREHQLAAQTLAERVLGDERLQLGDELVIAAESEVGVDSILERREAQLLEPRDLALCERLVPQVGQRLPAPKRKRLAENSSSAPRDWRAAAPRQERLEPGQVHLARGGVQQIAGRARPDPICAEQLAQGGDMPVQRGLHGVGWRLPTAPRSALARHDLLAVQEQHRKQRALLRARRGEVAATVDDLELTEDLELHSADCLTR